MTRVLLMACDEEFHDEVLAVSVTAAVGLLSDGATFAFATEQFADLSTLIAEAAR